MSFSIKLQEIYLYVLEEYKTERDNRNLRAKRATRKSSWSGQIFFFHFVRRKNSEIFHTRAEIAELVSKFWSGPIGFSTCGRREAHGVARVGTTSDYDRQEYFQILCCDCDILVTILILKCQRQKVHGEFRSTESLVRFLISAL